MSQRREALLSQLRAEISANSPLLVHTASSAPKYAPKVNVVLPAEPEKIVDPLVGIVGARHPLVSRASPCASPVRVGASPARSQAFHNTFYNSTAASLIYGGEPASNPGPTRRASPAPRPRTPTAQGAESAGSDSAAGSEVRYRAAASRPGALYREAEKNSHVSGLIYPNEAPPAPPTPRMWVEQPLKDGSHFVKCKKHIPAPEKKEVDRFGKRQHIKPFDNVEGCRIEMVTGHHPKSIPRETYYERPFDSVAPPFRTWEPGAATAPIPGEHLKNGLLGFRPTGRKHIEVHDTANLLDEQEGRPWSEQECPKEKPRGVHMVPEFQDTVQHSRINPTALADPVQSPPQEVHEVEFVSSTKYMAGPPPFVPIPFSELRWLPSPARGTSRISKPTDHDVISHDLRGAETGIAQLRVGRAPGQFSPMRRATSPFAR
jgi:hypothetical protein